MLMQVDGPGLAPLSGGKAAYLVVLLHGVAANGNDLISLGSAWRKILPNAEFIAPNAPFPSDYAPEARQWPWRRRGTCPSNRCPAGKDLHPTGIEPGVHACGSRRA